MKIYSLFFLFFCVNLSFAQSAIEYVETLDLDKVEAHTKQHFWMKIMDNGMSQPICVPVIVIKGKETKPVVGMLAAIHGNELNGIKVIQELVEEIDEKQLTGTIVAIPGLNGISLLQHSRRFIDDEDLNRKFPGKEKGNRSQQYVWQINQKILSQLDYLIDMHTASFGRENSLYVRANMQNDTMAILASLQDADIILTSDGTPSANKQTSSTRTMRAEAMLQGIPAITIEYGNPQVYQKGIY